MTIIFDKAFLEDGGPANQAMKQERLQVIHQTLLANPNHHLATCTPAEDADLERVHTQAWLNTIRENSPLWKMARLAAGGAITAARMAINGTPAFACIKPPGHHAWRNEGWGFCYLSNLAIALQYLRSAGLVRSALVLDIDAHTGDGTIDCLSDWPEAKVFNLMAETPQAFLKTLSKTLDNNRHTDIIAVSAGFDLYCKDVGKLLSRFDFYSIGRMIAQAAKRYCQGRCFAVLEGGYYLADLGSNVTAFCDGLGTEF